MGDDSEWLKLPTDEKCVHKVWKARFAGYEEAFKQFQTWDEKSPEFSKYLGLMKKFVTDSNAIAQEKALEAVLAFVENAHVAGKTSGEVCNGVVTKCLNASRAKTKERGMEILLMYIEIEKQEVVMDELLKGLTNKQPKVVVGCVQTLKTAIRDFGVKCFQIKPIVKNIPKLLEDRDKTVREETKLLTIEIYRWIGAALKPQLANLKPVQLTELEAEFEKAERPKQTRFLKSQQDLKAKMEAAAEDGDEEGREDGDEADGAVEIDPYELMTAVEILSKIPKDFYEKVEAKKWQERREALEAVQKLTENPRLEPGDYGDLVRALKKVVGKDTNVMLVAVATKCLCGLAVGLRKKFSSYAASCVETMLEKFKEKRPQVVAALKEAVDAIYLTTTLEAVSETCVENLGHKTPAVKTETAAFLARCFARCTPAILNKKLLKLFVSPLLKNVNDSAPEVREAAFTALGTAMKVVGEKPMGPYVSDLDNIKMGKIKEACENAVLVTKEGKAAAGSSGAQTGASVSVSAAAKPAKAPAKPEGKRPASATKKPGNSSAAPSGVSGRPKTAPGKGGSSAGGKKRPGTALEKGNKKAPDEFSENILADEAVEEKVSAVLPADSLAGLCSTNWKERLAAMEKFTEVVKTMSKDEIPCQAMVRTINKKPGLKDTNFQVLKLRVDLVAILAKNSKFSKRSADFCLNDLVDKVGDVKTGSAVKEALSCIAEACGLEYVSHQVFVAAFEQKNPKNQAEALTWLSTAIKEFGFKVNIKPMIENIKKALAATNPAVRTAAIGLLSSAYMYMGPTLRVFFENEKPALLQSIDAEFDKVKGEKPPAPTRGLVADEAGGVEEEEEDEEGGGDAFNVADLVPRNDISAKITDELLSEMSDKNWKIRNEGLQKLVAILNEAKFITPNIGGLPEALKARLGDSNKILMNTTLSICTTLATAMGPNIRNHVGTVGPGILNCLGDSKPACRAAAVGSLNAWVEQGGLQVFVTGELLSDALKIENPYLRSELLGWLAEKLPGMKKLPAELNQCIPHLFACLEDRNGDVRKKAHEALVPFMIHTGYEAMAKRTSKLKPASKDQIMGYLEKARGNLPAKPVKAKPSKPVPAATAAAALPVEDPEPESVEDEPAVPASKSSKERPAKGLKKKPPAAAASSRKKKEEEDTSPPLVANNGKEQRFKDEKALKVLKWNFTEPRQEFTEQLQKQMEGTFSKGLRDQLFHKDFKFHSKAIEVLSKEVENTDATIANLDLILKWVTLRFFDTNPSVLINALKFLQNLFSMLAGEDYHLQELEASSFIPYLVLKVGDSKDAMRREVRTIFKLICKVYPASKLFNYLIDGMKSKNAKQRTECVEELGHLIDVYGINVCQPSPAQALKIIAGQIGDGDKNARSAALNTIVTAYLILGEGVYKYIGNLSDKDLSMLEERIKRSKGRTANKAGSASPEERPKMGGATEQVNKRQRNGQDTSQPSSRNSSRPSSMASSRPNSMVKKEFVLDIDDESTVCGDQPELVQHDDDEELEEPVKLPTITTRPPSPSLRLVGGSTDAKSAIDLVISQIASHDISTSIQALAQIDEVMKDSEKAQLMANHIDQFLLTLSLQLRMACSKHLGDDNVPREEVIRLFKCLLGSLMSMFQCKDLAKKASKDILKDLVFNLITVLMDKRVADLDEGPQLIITVNVTVVKLVQKADQTNIMSALIKLLHDCIETETTSPKFIELIMKCLWKMARHITNIVDELNIDRILGDMHRFMTAYPSHTWKDRPSDTPLRTIKTVLHSIIKLKGKKILNHLSLIDQSSGSEIEAYIRKVLINGVDGGQSANQEGVSQKPEEDKKGQTPGTSKKISKTNYDILTQIFKKIGSKENSREGLNELYDFKLQHQDADVAPFLQKCSAVFQSYIERGLKNIEAEREKQAKTAAPGVSGSSGKEMEVIQNFQERLKVLKARCGLDNNIKVDPQSSSQVDKKVAVAIPIKKEPPGSLTDAEETLATGVNRQPSDVSQDPELNTDFDDLRRRLERIKKASQT